MKKSRKVSLQELSNQYKVVLLCKKAKEDANKVFNEAISKFDTLSDRTSKEVLAQFVREADLFS